MNFCTECGSKLEPGESFCTECGTKIDMEDALQQDSPSTQIPIVRTPRVVSIPVTKTPIDIPRSIIPPLSTPPVTPQESHQKQKSSKRPLIVTIAIVAIALPFCSVYRSSDISSTQNKKNKK